MIINHKWTEALDAPTPNVSGAITPKFIVMHYTATQTAKAAVRTLTARNSRVSAHMTVDLDGTMFQHAPFNVKTWHAGKSRHMGYTGLNSHSIGIEITNLGWLRNNGRELYRGNIRIPTHTMIGIHAHNPRVGGEEYFWPYYPQEQLAAVHRLTAALVEKYNIIDIVSHEEIDTRGWKTDPGPAFPMTDFKRHLVGNRSDEGGDRYEVTASLLNVRCGPGANFDAIDKVSRGMPVEVTDFYGDWARISDDGWVHKAYLRRA